MRQVPPTVYLLRTYMYLVPGRRSPVNARKLQHENQHSCISEHSASEIAKGLGQHVLRLSYAHTAASAQRPCCFNAAQGIAVLPDATIAIAWPEAGVASSQSPQYIALPRSSSVYYDIFLQSNLSHRIDSALWRHMWS